MSSVPASTLAAKSVACSPSAASLNVAAGAPSRCVLFFGTGGLGRSASGTYLPVFGWHPAAMRSSPRKRHAMASSLVLKRPRNSCSPYQICTFHRFLASSQETPMPPRSRHARTRAASALTAPPAAAAPLLVPPPPLPARAPGLGAALRARRAPFFAFPPLDAAMGPPATGVYCHERRQRRAGAPATEAQPSPALEANECAGSPPRRRETAAVYASCCPSRLV